jgi:hypothetical protein
MYGIYTLMNIYCSSFRANDASRASFCLLK